MIEGPLPDDEENAWRAVLARDRRADGRFVTGVLSTGIYCRPSCAARHPKRENVRFFASPADARVAGLRACLRCRPDDLAGDQLAIARVIHFISRAELTPSLKDMAAVAGYSPHHFHRLFRSAAGITPAAFARGVRARRMEEALAIEKDVTGAVYAAGYAGPGRFYADADRRLGMTPAVWRRGGQGITVRWVVTGTPLGELLMAETDRGICRVAFGENEEGLRRRFSNAFIEPGPQDQERRAKVAAARVPIMDRCAGMSDVLRRAAFEEAVWAELARMRSGKSADVAASVGPAS